MGRNEQGILVSSSGPLLTSLLQDEQYQESKEKMFLTLSPGEKAMWRVTRADGW